MGPRQFPRAASIGGGTGGGGDRQTIQRETPQAPTFMGLFLFWGPGAAASSAFPTSQSASQPARAAMHAF